MTRPQTTRITTGRTSLSHTLARYHRPANQRKTTGDATASVVARFICGSAVDCARHLRVTFVKNESPPDRCPLRCAVRPSKRLEWKCWMIGRGVRRSSRDIRRSNEMMLSRFASVLAANAGACAETVPRRTSVGQSSNVPGSKRNEPMDSEPPNSQARGQAKESLGDGQWFATFTLLDAGCAISASQMQRFVASIAKLWRWAIGRAA